jgi:hypothetical protein
LPIRAQSAKFADSAPITHDPGSIRELTAIKKSDGLVRLRSHVQGKPAPIDEDDVEVENLVRPVVDDHRVRDVGVVASDQRR